MRILSILFILKTLLLSDVVIVTNKNSKIENLSIEYIQYLYLKKVDVVENIKYEPLFCIDKTLHKRFVNTFLNKSIPQYNSYWARLVFTGKKAMPEKLSKKEILLRLKDENTIGYLEKEDLKEYMKVIYEISR